MPDLSDLAPPMVRRSGWYPDPSRAADLRWWDGHHWTDGVRPLDARTPSGLVVGGVIGGLLLPIVGAVVAIVLLARGQVGPGLAVLLASALGVAAYVAFGAG